MNPFYLIIPSRRLDNLMDCLTAITTHESNPPPVVVVDDGLPPFNYQTYPGLIYRVPGQTPFNFSAAINKAATFTQKLSPGSDFIILNDDAFLETPDGFTNLATAAQGSHYALVSSLVNGVVCNSHQQPHGQLEPLEPLDSFAAFIAVYIKRTTYNEIGPLDERFTGYGGEDHDYCHRIFLACNQIAVYKHCVVNHSHSHRSTFRTLPNIYDLLDTAGKLFKEKWSKPKPPPALPTLKPPNLTKQAWLKQKEANQDES